MEVKRVLQAPDLLERLGRPGFPKGMMVMLVGGPKGERAEIEEQLNKLGYQVYSCETCSQARTELDSPGTACYDIILAEACLIKDGGSGRALLEAASDLPLVLISSPGTTTECVWRGIEVGAADVLEKPLSLLKLQNIWQHVVRKAMDRQQLQAARPQKLSGKADEALAVQVEASPSCGRGTSSSSISAATLAPFPHDPSLADPEASFCDSQDGKDSSLDVSISTTSPENSLAVDSSSGFSDAARPGAEFKPKKAKRSREGMSNLAPAHSSKLPRAFSAGPYASSTVPSQRRCLQSAAPTVVGIVHPSWASSQAGTQAFRGSVPPGCVWGTPLHPPPGWQATLPNGSGPLLGSAASQCSISRCHSAPVHKAEPFGAPAPGLDGLPDLDAALVDDFAGELLLGDDFMECGDGFLTSLVPEAAAGGPPPEQPPIGLRLKKSESLVDLINQHLAGCRTSCGPPVPTA